MIVINHTYMVCSDGKDLIRAIPEQGKSLHMLWQLDIFVMQLIKEVSQHYFNM